MRNQRALAAACTAVAVLGLAAPAAAADGRGNGGPPTGNFHFRAHTDDDANRGREQGRGEDEGSGGRSEDFGGRGEDNGSGGRGDDSGRGDGSGSRGDDFGDRGDDYAGRGDDADGGGDELDGRGDGGPRNIVASPAVLPAGGRLAVTVGGCSGGTMSSRAFPATQLDSSRDDTSHGSIDIDRDARPGKYDIKIHCDGDTLIRPAAFTVLGGVRGGVGGSRSTGATPADMAIGAGLVTLAVVGGGAFWLRRRNEKRT
ncbi:hypothetical protein AB0L59_37805 [Streptomyces sp. NPDC052109]|uniref:hypothetical protein n=1 Tax=Streptomyces sp. NPDC052109 TaxID=3155527 RepID=UPI00342EA871